MDAVVRCAECCAVPVLVTSYICYLLFVVPYNLVESSVGSNAALVFIIFIFDDVVV